MAWSTTESFNLGLDSCFRRSAVVIRFTFVFSFSSSLSSSSEEYFFGFSFGMAKPGNLVASGLELFLSAPLSLPDDATGFMCWMIRSRFVVNESENSAPFSTRAFLKFTNVGFLSAKSMMNSAEIKQLVELKG